VFTPEIRQQVKEIIGSETNTLTKARKIFRLVSDNIPWNAEDEYCIISYFAKKGFMARRAGRAATNSDPATTGGCTTGRKPMSRRGVGCRPMRLMACKNPSSGASQNFTAAIRTATAWL